MKLPMLRNHVYTTIFLIAELYLFSTYGDHDARFHWFTHFFVGGAAALILMSIYAYRTNKPVKFPLLWIFIGHLYAMLPDILFNIGGIIHQPWMNIFLLHIDAHFISGRNVTWYIVFMVTLGLYLFTINWIRTRKNLPSRIQRNIVTFVFFNSIAQLIIGSYLLPKINASLSLWYVPLAIVMVLGSFIVLTPFIYFFYKTAGINISASKSTALAFSSEGFSRLIPFGDYMVQRHLLKKANHSQGVALDYIVTLYGFAILALIGLFLVSQALVLIFFPNQITSTVIGKFAYIPIFFSFLFVLGFILRNNHRLRKTLGRFFKKYFKRDIRSPFAIMNERKQGSKWWLWPLLLTWLIEGLAFYFSMLAFGVDIPLLLAIYVYSFVKIFRFVPLFPAGVGEIETVSTVLLAAYGFPVLPVLAGAITFKLLSFWIPILIGLVCYRKLDRKAFELSRIN